MGRATSEKLTRVHAPSTISSSSKGKGKDTSNGGGANSAGPRNPLFNTERYGQRAFPYPIYFGTDRVAEKADHVNSLTCEYIQIS